MNSVERLLVVYNSLCSQPVDQTMLGIWANVFELNLNEKHLEDDVSNAVGALRAQIEIARTRLLVAGVPEELASFGLDRLKGVASFGYFNTRWDSLRGNLLPPECRQSLLWGAWVLRGESETEMPLEDMQELLAALTELEDALQDTEMSPYLRAFIQRQVEAIRAALRVYNIRGAESLQDAMRKIGGDIQFEEAQLLKENDAATEEVRSILAKTANLIEKTAKVCDNLDKIKKFGEGFYALTCKVLPKLLAYKDQISTSLTN